MASPNFAINKPWQNGPTLFFLLSTFFCSCLPSHAKISYTEHCNTIEPQPLASGLPLGAISVHISNGYASGGEKILDPDPVTSSSSSNNQSLPGEFNFYTFHIYHTKTPGLFQLSGHLDIQGKRIPTGEIKSFRRTRNQFIWRDGVTAYGKEVSFDMSGFWSASTAKVCMVGTGSTISIKRTWSTKGTSYGWSGTGTDLKPSAVFNLNYPNNSNIYTSIVSGTVESLDASDSPSYFDTISVSGYAHNYYNYTLIPQAREICSHAKLPIELLGFETSAATRHLQTLLRGQYRLEYGRECSSLSCNPFSNKKSPEFLPTFMTLSSVYNSAEDGNVHMYFGFTNGTSYDYHNFLVPEKSLVGEGYWDQEKKLLCVLACPVLKKDDPLKDSSVGECTIGLSFWFPAVYTVKDRSNVMGRIWSVKGKSDPGYFNAISFRSLGGNIGDLPGVKYKYTEVDSVRKTCENTRVNNLENERYPDENSMEDFTFDLTVENAKGSTTSGYATPVSFGENFFGNSLSGISSHVSFSKMNHNISQTLWNVSYIISYSFYNSSSKVNEVTDISAEGVYNSGTGTLCMVGCRGLSNRKAEGSADCEIHINIQLSPLNQYKGEHVNGSSDGTRHLNGTIMSTRKNSDPLYFDPVKISSYTMYTAEASDTIRRMDMEIIMVMISLTLSCILIVLQIFHVRKHKDVLSSISITMLVILTLGYMIPLVLNLEGLFAMNGRKRNIMLWNGGWLEAKEVIVRVMTMVAFLLQFRLLQLAWTARSSKEGRKGLRIAEVKTLLFCLPLYFAGALIAWFAHMRSYKTQGESQDYFSQNSHSIWKDLLSYVGLILDGFLLPQIIINVVWNSKDKALSPLFYIGTTAVRAVPHLYDAYRARNYVPYLNFSYIYASPDADYYSTTWDIFIPLVGVMFAVLIFIQQQFGGSCLVPQRFRKNGGYEEVPVISL